MEKLLPKRLGKGSIVGIVAPSKKLGGEHRQYLEKFRNYLAGLGIETVLGKHIFSSASFGVAAGTPKERAQDINEMFKKPKIDAVWCFQGGKPANQVLDLIDYEAIKKHPKLFLGMSDVDLLLLSANKLSGLITFIAPDAKRGTGADLDFEYSRKYFIERLFEGKKEIVPSSEWKTVRKGKAKGKLLGCNITVILKLAGTKYFPDFSESVLFLEGYHEELDNTVWKLEQLRQLGVFDKIKGIVIGYVFGFQAKEQLDEKGNRVDYEQLVLEATKEYDFPILKINEFGHRCKNAFLPIGVQVEADSTHKKITILEDFIR